MTTLDEQFVTDAKEKYPEAGLIIDTLAEEVRRLEKLGARYEEALERIGRMENAPVIARQALLGPSSRPYSLGPSVAEQIEGAMTLDPVIKPGRVRALKRDENEEDAT
jgi:hypothetical protein